MIRVGLRPEMRMVVILNDNKWSIAPNVGAMAKYLNELITNPTYNRIHDDLESFLRKVPGGDSILRLGSRAKQEAKNMVVPSVLFARTRIACRSTRAAGRAS